jgi:hypothetical protein
MSATPSLMLAHKSWIPRAVGRACPLHWGRAMHSLALATSSQAYQVELTAGASVLLFAMPVPLVLQIHKRLREVAEIAAVAGDLGFAVLDAGGDTLHLHVAGCLVRYTVSDTRRVLTVIGIELEPEAGSASDAG